MIATELPAVGATACARQHSPIEEHTMRAEVMFVFRDMSRRHSTNARIDSSGAAETYDTFSAHV